MSSMDSELRIRDEHPGDREAVRLVNELAFGQPSEADLVEALHAANAATVALVAENANAIIGHILFSPVTVELANGRRLLGLAPMAVHPSNQRQGIGTRLVEEGLRQAALLGWDGVVVLGHPEYYPRFGFSPAIERGLTCEYEAPPEAFMVLALPGRSLAGVKGLVQYHPAFSAFA